MTKLIPSFKLVDPLKNIVVGDWLKIFRFSFDQNVTYEVAEVTRILDETHIEVQIHGEKKIQFLGYGVFKISRDEAIMHMLER